jgi:hypothetical protein
MSWMTPPLKGLRRACDDDGWESINACNGIFCIGQHSNKTCNRTISELQRQGCNNDRGFIQLLLLMVVYFIVLLSFAKMERLFFDRPFWFLISTKISGKLCRGEKNISKCTSLIRE